MSITDVLDRAARKAQIRQRLGVRADAGSGLMELVALVEEYLTAKDAVDALATRRVDWLQAHLDDALARLATAEDALRAVVA